MIRDVKSAEIYLDGGTTEISATNAGGKLRIVQDQSLATASETRLHNYIVVNGKRLPPGGAKEHCLLEALDGWVIRQLMGQSVVDFKQRFVNGQVASKLEERAFVVIGLIEGVCNARDDTRYATLCVAYNVGK